MVVQLPISRRLVLLARQRCNRSNLHALLTARLALGNQACRAACATHSVMAIPATKYRLTPLVLLVPAPVPMPPGNPYALALLVSVHLAASVLLLPYVLKERMKKAARVSLTTASQTKHVLMVSVFLSLNVQQDRPALMVSARKPSAQNPAHSQALIPLIPLLRLPFARVAALSSLKISCVP